MPRGGTTTPISPGLVARLSGAVRGGIRGARDAWFGPSEPLAPMAPEEVRGRQFDFPVAFNIVQRPRGEQGESGIDFPTLRALADPTLGGFDLLRLAIETRKDQMESQRWKIQGRDESDGGEKARAIEQVLRFPDGVHTFSQWRRMLLEDLFVIDAPAIYLRPTVLGYRLPELIDGGSLKRLLRPDGRVPLPPDPAFQQIIKGLPAVDYSLDEIVYAPRNLRSYRVYGFSPVEQVQLTVSIALRRQLSQLEYYTAGSVPDAIAGLPESWNKDQVAQFQLYWDSVISGNTEERRRVRFVPGGVAMQVLKAEALKDEFDEWLAKIICYCFSLSPQALIKQMNRASAETSKQTAQEEGLEPLKLWLADVMDSVLAKAFDAPELQFVHEDEEIANPEQKANVFATALGKGGGKAWLTQDEVRAEYGYDPLTAKQKTELQPPAPQLTAGPDEAAQANADEQKQATELAELRARSDSAAAMALAVAHGMEQLAKAVGMKSPKKTVAFERDKNGAVTHATMTNGASE